MVKMTVDAMGDHCPIPVVKTKKRLENYREQDR
ncbi:sulfurtransferase TusA family protein [[Ruminococcus] torques]|nr:sulfurtransferase TusA family protein [[Ruminococcus] torques]